MWWFTYGVYRSDVVAEESLPKLEETRAVLRGFGYHLNERDLPMMKNLKGGLIFGYVRKFDEDENEKDVQLKYRALYGSEASLLCRDVNVEMLQSKEVVCAKLFFVAATSTVRSGDVLLESQGGSSVLDKFQAFHLSTKFFGRCALDPHLTSKFKDYLFRIQVPTIQSVNLYNALYFLIFQDESFEKHYDEYSHSRFLDQFVEFLRNDGELEDEEEDEEVNFDDFATGDPFNIHDPYHDLPFLRNSSSKSNGQDDKLPKSVRVVVPNKILLGPHPAFCQDSEADWNVKQVLYTLIHEYNVQRFCHVDEYAPFDLKALALEAWNHRYQNEGDDDDVPLTFLRCNILDCDTSKLSLMTKDNIVTYMYAGSDEDLEEIFECLQKKLRS